MHRGPDTRPTRFTCRPLRSWSFMYCLCLYTGAARFALIGALVSPHLLCEKFCTSYRIVTLGECPNSMHLFVYSSPHFGATDGFYPVTGRFPPGKVRIRVFPGLMRAVFSAHSSRPKNAPYLCVFISLRRLYTPRPKLYPVFIPPSVTCAGPVGACRAGHPHTGFYPGEKNMDLLYLAVFGGLPG